MRSTDGGKFEGFIPELLPHLSETVGFSYEITSIRRQNVEQHDWRTHERSTLSLNI